MPHSFSQLKSYATCPRQFEYAFVKKLKAPLTPESCFGVSVHTTLSKWGKLEQVSGSRFPAFTKVTAGRQVSGKEAQFALPFSQEKTTIPDTYHLTSETLFRLWHSSFVIEGYPTRAAAEFDRSRGEKLMERFYAWWMKEPRKVLAVEKGFAIEVDSASSSARPVILSGASVSERRRRVGGRASAQHDRIELTGRFDRIEELPDGTLRIIDFKSGSLRSQEEVDRDLQMSIYALGAREAFGKEASELVMLFLGDEEITEVKTMRTSGELGTAKKTIELLAERIASKDYRPTPSKEICRHCPYRRICDVSAV